jgi:DNA polymerase-3 subunit delta'
MITAFREIVGQERAVAQLAQALDRPRHAYLLVGPPNVGKTKAAEAWSQALFCRSRTACGDCIACRTFLHGNYADFHLWQPAGKSTSIEQVRDLVRQADLAPYRGDFQVHVVFADTLTLPAANCLLKTLEEPPQGTILLLVAQSVADILPTIVSRCQRIPFNLVPEPLIRDWLVAAKGIAPAIAEAAARRSGGRIGYAAALLDQEATSPRLLAARDALDALEEADRAAALPQDRQLQILEDLTLLVRDTMVFVHTGREDWVGQPDAARKLAATGRTREEWSAVLTLLEDARIRLNGGANARLAWTVMAGELVRTAR